MKLRGLEDKARRVLYRADSVVFTPKRLTFTANGSRDNSELRTARMEWDKEDFQNKLLTILEKTEEAKTKSMEKEIDRLREEIDKLQRNEKILVDEVIKQQELYQNSLRITHIQEQKHNEDINMENNYKSQIENYRMELMTREDVIAQLRRENESK